MFFLIHSVKTLREQRLREQQAKLLQLQNGRVSPLPEEEESPPQSIMGLDLSTWEDRSSEQKGRSLPVLSSRDDAIKEQEEDVEAEGENSTVAQAEEAEPVPASAMVVVRERSRTVDEPGQKNTRAKRESRRMRELEQAKFSLELLKVRANSGGASSPSEERRWSLELMPISTPPLRSPQGTPDSQSSKGSFELLNMDDEAPKAVEESIDSEEPCSPPPESDPGSAFASLSPEPTKPTEPHETATPDAVPLAETQADLARLPATAHPPKLENYLPTFYVPTSEGSAFSSRQPIEDPPKAEPESISTATNTAAITKHLKERRDSGRRPVVVVISMQKETPLSQEQSHLVRPPAELRDSGAQTEELSSPLKQRPGPTPTPPPTPPPTTSTRTDTAVLEKLVRLSEQREERQRSQRRQDEREMMEQIRQQKELLERQRLYFAQCERELLEKQRDEALQRIQQSQRQAGQKTGGLEVGGQQATGPAPSSAKPLRPDSLLLARTAAAAPLQPHARTQSDSTPPPTHPDPPPQLPPPPASAPRERRRATAGGAAEGWAPNLTLESKDRAANRARATNRKPPSSQLNTVSMTDKSGKIFFSPKDKVTFAK